MKADIYTIGGKPGIVKLEENIVLINLALHDSTSAEMASESIIEPHMRLACLLAEKVKQEKETGNPLVDELRAVVKKHDERKRQMKQGGVVQANAPTEKKPADASSTNQVDASSTKTAPVDYVATDTPKKVKDSGPVAEALYRLLAGKRLKSDEAIMIAAGWTIHG